MIISMFALFSCKSGKELSTVSRVDLEKYSGKWYEIARLPNSFEKGLKCVTAEYSLMENSKVKVVNSGHEIGNPQNKQTAEGKAKVPNADYPGRLKVTFFWPFYGDYYIIHLDDNYQYALVGSPSRKYLWILARKKTISEDVKQKLLKIADEQGFKTDDLIWVKQDCKN